VTVRQTFDDQETRPPVAFSARLFERTDDPLFARFRDSKQNVFQSERFLAEIERHVIGPSCRLVLVGATDGFDNPVAAFVFVRRRKLGLWIIEGLDFGITDYFAPTLFRDTPLSADETDALWRSVIKALPKADAIVFKKLPLSLHQMPHALSAAVFLTPMGACATTLHMRDASGAPNGRMDQASLSRKVKKVSKIFEKKGVLRFCEARTQAEIDLYLRTLICFRKARFTELGREDLLLDDRIVAFYRALAEANRQHTPGRLFALYLGDEIVAITYGFAYRDVFTPIIPTITTNKEALAGSPGLLAMFKTLQWSLEHGFHVFDLSVGALHYKTRFEAEPVELFEYQQALTPLGHVLVAEAAARRRIRFAAAKNPKIKAAAEKVRNLRWRSLLRAGRQSPEEPNS
jgi:CelD/BcsL family acetyltransferase involved in cellulose biosynthesis